MKEPVGLSQSQRPQASRAGPQRIFKIPRRTASPPVPRAVAAPIEEAPTPPRTPPCKRPLEATDAAVAATASSPPATRRRPSPPRDDPADPLAVERVVRELSEQLEANGGPSDPSLEVEIRVRSKGADGRTRPLDPLDYQACVSDLAVRAFAGRERNEDACSVTAENIWGMGNLGRLRQTNRLEDDAHGRDRRRWVPTGWLLKKTIWHRDVTHGAHSWRVCLSKEVVIGEELARGLLAEYGKCAPKAMRDSCIVRYKRRVTLSAKGAGCRIDATEVATDRLEEEDPSGEVRAPAADRRDSLDARELEIEFEPSAALVSRVESVLRSCLLPGHARAWRDRPTT